MDKPISVGDLVMVVRGPFCCRNPERNGLIFKVEKLSCKESAMCRYCGNPRGQMMESAAGGGHTYYTDRLKRIPPLEELEREKLIEKLIEKLTEPA